MSGVNSKLTGLVERRRSNGKGRRSGSIVVIGNNNDHLNREQRDIDRDIYKEKGSLLLAPTNACPCELSICKERRMVQTFKRYIKEKEYVCLTPEGYGNICITRADGYVELKYSTSEKRMCTFRNDGRCNNDGFNSKLAEAGFYVTQEGETQGRCVSLSCFRCPIRLRLLDEQSDPFREHARWFPCCAYVMHKKGMEFIHSVLQDTRKIQQEHDERDSSQMTVAYRREPLN